MFARVPATRGGMPPILTDDKEYPQGKITVSVSYDKDEASALKVDRGTRVYPALADLNDQSILAGELLWRRVGAQTIAKSYTGMEANQVPVVSVMNGFSIDVDPTHLTSEQITEAIMNNIDYVAVATREFKYDDAGSGRVSTGQISGVVRLMTYFDHPMLAAVEVYAVPPEQIHQGLFNKPGGRAPKSKIVLTTRPVTAENVAASFASNVQWGLKNPPEFAAAMGPDSRNLRTATNVNRSMYDFGQLCGIIMLEQLMRVRALPLYPSAKTLNDARPYPLAHQRIGDVAEPLPLLARAPGPAQAGDDERYIYRRRNNEASHPFWDEAGFRDGYAYDIVHIDRLLSNMNARIEEDPAAVPTTIAVALGLVSPDEATQTIGDVARVDDVTRQFYGGTPLGAAPRADGTAPALSVQQQILRSMYCSRDDASTLFGWRRDGTNPAINVGKVVKTRAQGRILDMQLHWDDVIAAVTQFIAQRRERQIGKVIAPAPGGQRASIYLNYS